MFEQLLDSELGGGDYESLPAPASADDFLNQDLSGYKTFKRVELKEGEIDPRFLRTSYSSDLLFHSCPRKAQLKALGAKRAIDPESNITFAFGHVVGDGIQQLLVGTPMETVLMNTFLGWHAPFDAVNEKQNKGLAQAVWCLKQFASMMEDGFLSEYEVAYFEGKPAAELSFRIALTKSYFRGYVDLVLQHRITGEYLVLELKTTSSNYVKPSQYKNSAQAIGYSVVLDRIAPGNSSYGVLYLVYLTKQERFETFEFPKTYHQRALWLRDVLWDEECKMRLIEREGNYGIWPMHGESCNSFGRDCEHMDECHMSTERMMVPLNESHLLDLDRVTEEEIEYQFEFTLGELFEAQERASNGEVSWEVIPATEL